MATISVILPVSSSLVKNFDELFEKAIESIKKQQSPIDELVLVHTDEESLVNFISNFDFGDLNVKKVVNDTENTDFQSQVNMGIENSTS